MSASWSVYFQFGGRHDGFSTAGWVNSKHHSHRLGQQQAPFPLPLSNCMNPANIDSRLRELVPILLNASWQFLFRFGVRHLYFIFLVGSDSAPNLWIRYTVFNGLSNNILFTVQGQNRRWGVIKSATTFERGRASERDCILLLASRPLWVFQSRDLGFFIPSRDPELNILFQSCIFGIFQNAQFKS